MQLMFLFCVLILPNCPLFVCVFNLTFHISRQVSSMFRKKIINASSNLKRGLHLGTKIVSNVCFDIGTEGVYQFILFNILGDMCSECLI